MKQVEIYARVRHAVLIEGISERAAAERFGINARTVSKMLKFSVPPGYVRTKPPVRPKVDEFTGLIDAILAADKDRPKKQRHTSKRVFERLRDEHGFTGKVTIVKDYVSGWRQRTQSILYDNTKIAVGRILGDGKRQRTRVFSELQSHYLFTDRFGRPGKGNDKGKVEGLVGYARRNFLVPIPVFSDFEALNAHLLV